MKTFSILLLVGLMLSAVFGQTREPQTWPQKFAAGLHTTVTAPVIRPLWVVTGLGILAAMPFDQDVQTVRNDLMSNQMASFGDAWGGAWAAITILPGIYLTDVLKGSPWGETARHIEFATLSLATVGATTALMKLAAGRERPNGRGNLSFPSGHTSISFGVAEVVRTLYGNRAGAVLYSLAVVTGISRIHDNKHYLSDVVAGAGLGIGLVRGFYIALQPKSRLDIKLTVPAPGMVGIELRF